MGISSSAFAARFKDITAEYDLPPSMVDCKVYFLQGRRLSYPSLYSIQCPNSKVGVQGVQFKDGKQDIYVDHGDIIEINGKKYKYID